MLAYPLQDLLKIRILREDSALRALNQAKDELSAARAALTQAQKQRDDFRVFLAQEQVRLYDTIMQKKVRRYQVDDVKLEISILQKKQLDYDKKVVEAENQVQKALQNVEEKDDNYRLAIRNHEKIQAHKNQFMADLAKRQEAALDKELEDFKRRQDSLEELYPEIA